MPDFVLLEENEDFEVPVSRVLEYAGYIIAAGKADDFSLAVREADATVRVSGSVINMVKTFIDKNRLQDFDARIASALDCEPPCPK